jgi:hypothetical protein
MIRMFIVVGFALYITVYSQGQGAGIGKPCDSRPDPLRPSRICGSGLMCKRSNGRAFKCACSGDLIIDPGSNECRRRLGYYCQPEENNTIYNDRHWSDKCQDQAECRSSNGGLDRRDGVCECKDGLSRDPTDQFCEEEVSCDPICP